MDEASQITGVEAMATVEASPRCVGEHDKVAWLDLFAADAVVEDPVGGAPARRGLRRRLDDDELGRFYDTFIADNTIRFEVERDIVAGAEVIRDVAIHTTLATGLEITVPAILLYSLAREGETLKIARLQAHWELPRMSREIATKGLRGLRTMLLTTWTMFSVQGARGLIGYSQGLMRGIVSRGRRVAGHLARTLSAGDVDEFARFFVATATIECPGDGPEELSAETPRAWFARQGPGASLSVSKVISSGWVTSFRMELRSGEEHRHGIGFLDFDRRSLRVARARFYFA